MSEKIIFVPFAFHEKSVSGLNTSTNSNKISVYFSNLCCSLVSSKHFNLDADVALVTNLEEQKIPAEFLSVLQKNGILIYQFPFDRFCFPENYPWALAFYKLCAISHLLDLKYEKYICLDADTWVQDSVETIWQEIDQSLLLYDIHHGLQIANYIKFLDEFEAFTNSKKYITHFGGEFIAGNKTNLRKFHETATDIYLEMLNSGFETSKGDEFIISITASRMKELVKNAGAYVCRFWTSNFRLVSTCYKANKVIVLHVPDEKEFGMKKLFSRFIKKNRFPKEASVWRMLHLNRPYYHRVLYGRIINCMNHLSKP